MGPGRQNISELRKWLIFIIKRWPRLKMSHRIVEMQGILSMKSISILMSLYNPNESFLFKQLDSINNQDYKGPIEVLVHNDNPKDMDRELQISDHLPNCTVKYYHSQHNLGYVKAFERLVLLASGDFIVFCDQDDVWKSNRLSRGADELNNGSIFCVSDRMIIDENDEVLVQSWKNAHPLALECRWHTGDIFTKHAATRCYAIGMATMVRADYAKRFCPYPDCTGHDKWIALCASASGKCSFIDEPLVMYRRHGNNVSGQFQGIKSKEDWYSERITPSLELAKLFNDKFPQNPNAGKIMKFANARKSRNPLRIMRYVTYDPTLVLFESALAITPEWLFKKLLGSIQ